MEGFVMKDKTKSKKINYIFWSFVMVMSFEDTSNIHVQSIQRLLNNFVLF